MTDTKKVYMQKGEHTTNETKLRSTTRQENGGAGDGKEMKTRM
jgi:hypothetical protein